MISDDFEMLLGQLADVADALTLPVWNLGVMEVEIKSDGSPVTATDMAVEVELRALLAKEFPEDGFCGEEVGETPGQSGRTWIVDGIDGTAAFTTARAEWSTLIALVVGDDPVGGIVTSPALKRRWYSSPGQGAHIVVDGGSPERLLVSSQSILADAQVTCWPSINEVRPAFVHQAKLLAGVLSGDQGSLRPSWDSLVPNGAMLVAQGQLDAFVLFGGKAWDHAAPAAVVRAAGGRFSSLEGTTSVGAGNGLYSNNEIHDELLELLNSKNNEPE